MANFIVMPLSFKVLIVLHAACFWESVRFGRGPRFFCGSRSFILVRASAIAGRILYRMPRTSSSALSNSASVLNLRLFALRLIPWAIVAKAPKAIP